MTKTEARRLDWNQKKGNLANVASGKSIGGDVFRNKEGLLPNAKNRIWYEADINYTSGYRG
ncbi:ribonuclease domain-containing protein [Clostridium sp. CTA-19]